MITSGFFNSVGDDRPYNADQMSKYFKGIITNGVLMGVGGAMQVTAGSGMTVNIASGRAFLESRWVELDDTETLTITAAHATLSRYTTVVVRLSMEDREITLDTIDGTPASSPVPPSLIQTDDVLELGLANVLILPGATTIQQQYIVDTRADSSRCGYCTGVITQLDTSQLFAQWQAAYQSFYTAFQSWFETLTQELQVNTYIKQFQKRVTGTAAECASVPLDMTGYTYDPADVVLVYINGLAGAEGTDFQVRDDGVVLVTIGANSSANNTVLIRILKSVIGNPPQGAETIEANTTFTVESE